MRKSKFPAAFFLLASIIPVVKTELLIAPFPDPNSSSQDESTGNIFLSGPDWLRMTKKVSATLFCPASTVPTMSSKYILIAERPKKKPANDSELFIREVFETLIK